MQPVDLNHPKSQSKLKKVISYDPNGNISDLPYNQVKPESKIKSLIVEAKRNYRE
jgi:hypothetical protein